MKRYFWMISTAAVFVCGLVLHIAYEESGRAAWSLIVSSTDSSPWEMMKPFGLVYIMFVFIELSCLRPSLMHFVCAKIIGLLMFVGGALICLHLINVYSCSELIMISGIGCILGLSEMISYRIYRSEVRTEIFSAPLLVAFVIVFFMLLLYTFLGV